MIKTVYYTDNRYNVYCDGFLIAIIENGINIL